MPQNYRRDLMGSSTSEPHVASIKSFPHTDVSTKDLCSVPLFSWEFLDPCEAFVPGANCFVALLFFAVCVVVFGVGRCCVFFFFCFFPLTSLCSGNVCAEDMRCF